MERKTKLPLPLHMVLKFVIELLSKRTIFQLAGGFGDLEKKVNLVYPGLIWVAGHTPSNFPSRSSNSYDEVPFLLIMRAGTNWGPNFEL